MPPGLVPGEQDTASLAKLLLPSLATLPSYSTVAQTLVHVFAAAAACFVFSVWAGGQMPWQVEAVQDKINHLIGHFPRLFGVPECIQLVGIIRK